MGLENLYKVVMDLRADVRIDLPEDALALLSILDDAGFEAWAVGGFVRDALLGRPSTASCAVASSLASMYCENSISTQSV